MSNAEKRLEDILGPEPGGAKLTEPPQSNPFKPASLHRGLEKVIAALAVEHEVDAGDALEELNGDGALATLIRRMVGDVFGSADTPLQDLLLVEELAAAGMLKKHAHAYAAKLVSEKDASGTQRRNVQSGETIKGNVKKAKRAQGGKTA